VVENIEQKEIFLSNVKDLVIVRNDVGNEILHFMIMRTIDK